MNEKASFNLNGADGKQYEATPENSHLFLYLGELGLYSNATVQLSEEPPVFTRIFYHHDGFNQVRDYMLENCYPSSVNLRIVGAGVLNSFEKEMKTMAGDLDTIPDDWTNEEPEA